jgi:hypothetical protein
LESTRIRRKHPLHRACRRSKLPYAISNEAERFGCSGIDDFVNVDAHFVGNDFHLVHQADVYGAVDVFQKFGQLGSFGGAYWNNFILGLLS